MADAGHWAATHRGRSSLLQRWPSPEPRCMRPFRVSGPAVAGCCTGSVGEQVAQARVLSQLQQRQHVPRVGPTPLSLQRLTVSGPVSRRRLGSAHGRPDFSLNRTRRCGKSSVLLLCWMRCLGIEPGPSRRQPAALSKKRFPELTYDCPLCSFLCGLFCCPSSAGPTRPDRLQSTPAGWTDAHPGRCIWPLPRRRPGRRPGRRSRRRPSPA